MDKREVFVRALELLIAHHKILRRVVEDEFAELPPRIVEANNETANELYELIRTAQEDGHLPMDSFPDFLRIFELPRNTPHDSVP